MALTSGTKLGPYEIVALLGAGGMGEVYRARDTRLGRDVAIKVLPESFAPDPDRLRRFEQEACALAALNLPNILAIHDIGSHAGAPYLVSELLEGATLRQRLSENAPPVKRVIDYVLQMVHGLGAAHQKGIIHRDLKPENIFVTRDGRIKILDFGLAKLARPEAASAPTLTGEATGSGIVMGTVGYMSPEQVRGAAADHRSDVFALGTILYEMLTGQRAFKRDTSAETMAAILNIHLLPAFGKHRLCDLGTLEIQRFVLAKMETGLSWECSDHYRNLLSKVFETAKKWAMFIIVVSLNLANSLLPRSFRRCAC